MSEWKQDSENTEERLLDTEEKKETDTQAETARERKMKNFSMMIIMRMKPEGLPGWNAETGSGAEEREGVLRSA